MSADVGRGGGYLQLNTPASIQYTEGSTLTGSDLKRKRSRSETIKLPESQLIWRKAFEAYTTLGGYRKFEQDVLDEKNGEGVQLVPAVLKVAKMDQSGGMKMVFHHKVSGTTQFVYPDYDGIMSSGPVPLLVKSEAEIEEEKSSRKYYVSPDMLTEEEQLALEELQAMWKGGDRRGAPFNLDDIENGRRHTNSNPSNSLPAVSHQQHTGQEEISVDKFDSDLMNALRAADDLLNLV